MASKAKKGKAKRLTSDERNAIATSLAELQRLVLQGRFDDYGNDDDELDADTVAAFKVRSDAFGLVVMESDSQTEGSCNFCATHTRIDGPPWSNPHRVFVVSGRGISVRFCDTCLDVLADGASRRSDRRC